jgi:hypothetical protein
MIVFRYASKKELKENIGKPLKYIETSLFGEEYVSDGLLVGVLMENNLIKKVK